MRRLIAPLMTIALLGYLVIPRLDTHRLPLSLLSADMGMPSMGMKGTRDIGQTYHMLVDNALAFQDFTMKNPQMQLTPEASHFLDNMRAHIQDLPDLKLFEFFPLMEWLTPNHSQEGIIVTALIYMQENPEYITEEVKAMLLMPHPEYSMALQSIVNQTISLQMGMTEH